jgi:hypothetical protein
MRAKLVKFVPSNGNKVCFCPLCNKQLETAQQIFLGCDIVRIIWRQSNWPLKIHAFENFPIGTWIKLLLILQNMLPSPKKTRFSNICYYCSGHDLVHARLCIILIKWTSLIKQVKLIVKSHLVTWENTAPM